MHMNLTLTAERLREVVSYDPLTGEFAWKQRPQGRGNNRLRAGDRAGGPTSKGYHAIKIDGKTYKAHRLAWLYVTGEWPAHQIDHKDTIKSNNRFANLREATPAENAQNQLRPSSNNKSGRLGVTWCKEQEKWAATLRINGRNVRLGRFADQDEASAAYWAAKAAHHPFANVEGVAG